MTIQVRSPFLLGGVWRQPGELITNLSRADEDVRINAGLASRLGGNSNVLYDASSGILNANGRPILTRLPTKAKIAIFTDSFGVYYKYATATAMTKGTGSPWTILLAMIGDERFDIVNYSAVPGNTAALMRARYDTALKGGAHNVVIGGGGVNDFFGSVSTPNADDVLADYLYFIDDQINNYGNIVIWHDCMHQLASRSNYTVAKAKEAMRYNRLFAQAALTRPGLIALPLGQLSRDSNDATNFAAKSDATLDGIHPWTGLNARAARVFFPMIDPIFPLLPRQFSQGDASTETWSDSLFPAGRGQMAGTGGTKGTGVSGGSTVPDGWTAAGTASTTVDVSKVPSEDGNGDWVEVKVSLATGVTTAQTVSLSSATFHTLLQAGDKPGVMFEMQIDDAGGSTITEISGRQYNVVGGLVRHTIWNSITNGTGDFSLGGKMLQVKPQTHGFEFADGSGLDGNPTTSQVYFDFKTRNTTGGTTYALFRVRNVKPKKF